MSCENQFEESVENLRKLFSLNENIFQKSFHIKEVIKCMAGSSSGDNYMSVVKRIQISGYRDVDSENDGDPQLLSVIIKRQIPSLSRRQLYRCDEAFCNEINAYQHIVPMLDLYTKAEDSVFPKCFFAGKDDLGEIILLEDLKATNYSMQNRLIGLDLHCCELVMRQLAKFHAASIAAKQLNGELFREKCQQIREIVYCKEAEEFYKNVLETSIQESLNSLKASNEEDGSLTGAICLIEKLQPQLFRKIQRYVLNSKEQFNVVCHGDLWVNNIMFTNLNTEAAVGPTGVKFFDLQAIRVTSPVFDILHFIYTSTKRQLRDAYTDSLLKTYCHALAEHLEIHFTHDSAELESVKNTFSLQNITAEYYEHVLYGLAISMWILPAVTFDPNDIPNLDEISELKTSAKEIKCTPMLTAEYHSRLKDLALEFYEKGYLNVELTEQ